MDEFNDKNGQEESRLSDRAEPQQGEPFPEQSVNDSDDTAEGGNNLNERLPARGLPLPLLHELEQAPSVRPPAAPDTAEESTAPDAEADGTGRRLSEQWRIDLKWIFGIPATVILILTLAAFAWLRVSDEEAASQVIANMRLQMLDDARFHRELALVDPQMLKLLASEDLEAAIYEDPEMMQAAIDAIPDSPEGDPLAGQVEYVRSSLEIFRTLSGTIGKNEHIQARSALIVLVLMLMLFGVPYVIFSRRLGRIVSPAVSLALASWLPLLGILFFRGSLADWMAERPGIVEEYQTDFVTGMVDTFAGGLADVALPTYRFFSLLALIMMGFGLLGLLIVWWRFNESMIPRKKKLRD